MDQIVMDQIVIVNYTQEEIDNVICSLDTLYTNLMSKLAKNWLFSIGCIDNCFNEEVFLYRWAIDDLTLLDAEEKTNLVNKIKDITCSC